VSVLIKYQGGKIMAQFQVKIPKAEKANSKNLSDQKSSFNLNNLTKPKEFASDSKTFKKAGPSTTHFPGKKMPMAVQQKMETAFNANFDNVNIYVGKQASDIGALAYTQGNNIYFAQGQYKPTSQQGQELLGHELAHVVQQRQGRVKTTLQAKGFNINNNSYLEKEADKLGKKAIKGVPIFTGKIPTTIQNDEVVQLQIKHEGAVRNKTQVWADGADETEQLYDPSGRPNATRQGKRADELEAIINPRDAELTGQGTVSVEPLGWWWIGYASNPKKSRTGANLAHSGWVRFHLLNANLGGRGDQCTHLVPTTNKANSSGKWQKNFEEKAKKEVNKNEILHYYVKVTEWHSPPNDGQNPPPLGDQYFHFFPKEIKAQYRIWNGQSWGVENKVDLTQNDGLYPPPREPGEQVIYYSNISESQLKIFGISSKTSIKLFNLLNGAKDKLYKLNAQSTPQKLYNILYDQVESNSYFSTLDPQQHIKTEREFNRIWDDEIEKSLKLTGNKKALIAPGWSQPPQIVVKKNIEITKKDIMEKNISDLQDLIKFHDDTLSEIVWTVIKEIVKSGRDVTSYDIYKEIVLETAKKMENEAVKYLLKVVDQKWDQFIREIDHSKGGYYIKNFRPKPIKKLTDIKNGLTNLFKARRENEFLAYKKQSSKITEEQSSEITKLYESAWRQMNIEKTLSNPMFLICAVTDPNFYQGSIQRMQTKFESTLKSIKNKASNLEHLFSIHQELFVPLERYKDRGLNLPIDKFNEIKNAIINQTSDRGYNFSFEKNKLIELVRKSVYIFFKTKYSNYLNEDDKQGFIYSMNRTFSDKAKTAISNSLYGISVHTDIIDKFISEDTIKALLEQFKQPELKKSRREPQSTEERGRQVKRRREDEETVESSTGTSSKKPADERFSKQQRTEPQSGLSPTFIELKSRVSPLWESYFQQISSKDIDNAQKFKADVKKILFGISNEINEENLDEYYDAVEEGIKARANHYLIEKDKEREKEGDSINSEDYLNEKNHLNYGPSTSGSFGNSIPYNAGPSTSGSSTRSYPMHTSFEPN
jgi:hypothetical protein